MIYAVEKEKCTGCKACGDVCPTGAIRFDTDMEGFWYPKVDENRCIKCKKCLNTCPALLLPCHTTQRAYAAWNRNDETRRRSTSGGVYEVLARIMLEQGYYLAACEYDDDFCGAHHKVGNTEDDLKKMIGSKYFQSDTAGIYQKIKTLLKAGEKVFFTGTPCQVAAVYQFIGERPRNLVTCDFICRGVPSPMMQKKKIEYYQAKYHTKVIGYQDKYKEYSWSFFGQKVRFQNGKTLFVNRYVDWFNDCYVKYNLNIRPSCFACTFKQENHLSDITIGDFWGIKGCSEKDLRDGISAVITNTPVGEELLRGAAHDLFVMQRTIQEVGAGNPAHMGAPKPGPEREALFRDVQSMNLKRAILKNTPSWTLKTRIQNYSTVLKGRLMPYKDLIKNAPRVRWGKFIYYNFLAKQINRDRWCFLIPFGNCDIRLAPDAKIELHGNLLINYYAGQKGKGASQLQLDSKAVFVVRNRAEFAFGSVVTIHQNAYFETGAIHTRSGPCIICNNKIVMGENVMFGRDVCVFDSDFHGVFDLDGTRLNPDSPVYIEDNVWLGAKSMVLKGVTVHKGAIVGAGTVVKKDVAEKRRYVSLQQAESIGREVFWEK